MTRLIVTLALAVTPIVAESIDLSSPELIAQGSSQFARSCAVGYCHGSEGRAARGPALRDRVWDAHELYGITANGLDGTSMPAWKDVLSDQAVWAVTAYVLSLSSEPPSGGEAVIELGPAEAVSSRPPLSEKAVRGKKLFFDLTREGRCGVCHQLDGLGTAIGPNLVLTARAKTHRDLTRDILEPHSEIAYGFEQVQLDLLSGERLSGVLAEETDTRIRVFDAASVPPPLRSVAKSDVRRQRTLGRSSMPSDLGEVYSAAEIDSIVTYLRETAR